MNKLLVALIAVAPLFAQAPSCTTVTQTLYNNASAGNPVPMSGTIVLSFGYSSLPAVQIATQINVIAGVVNTCLVPGVYTADYTVKNPLPLRTMSNFRRYWTVPASGPVTVSAIEAQTVVTPNLSISWSQLPTPPASGTYCPQSVNGVISWGSCGGGGGGSFTLSSMTNSQLSSLTNSQLSSLTN